MISMCGKSELYNTGFQKPIRILHVVSTMDYGGVETLLMSIYRNIDRSKIQFDFLCHNRLECKFREEILSLGGRMYMVHGPRHGGVLNYIKELRAFFSEHPEYQIVHAHMNRDNAFVLSQAKCAHVKYRISHSHVAGGKYKPPYSIYVFFAKKINNHCLTHRFACSQAAGKDLYGGKAKFNIITNGIAVDRFRFDQNLRDDIRRKYGMSQNEYVIGHVGRFDDTKNQEFLVKIFRCLHDKNHFAKLLLVGSGPMEDMIRHQVIKCGLEKDVIFAGSHANLQGYYSVMDVFVFPSKYEGLGIVAVEAQCAGLFVVASDQVPSEVKIADKIRFLSLNKQPDEWADIILEKAREKNNREVSFSTVRNSIYNIKHSAEFLETFYIKLAER